jgi:microcystin-dependent protein
MALFRFKSRQVSDPAAQMNFDQLESLVFTTGDLKPTALDTAPAGWLICDGAALTTTHAAQDLRRALLAASSPFGTSGSDPKIPDLRGRAPIGAGTGSGLTARTLGATGGTEPSNMPDHTHSKGYGSNVGLVPSGATFGIAPQENTGGVVGGVSGANNMMPFAVINWLIRT